MDIKGIWNFLRRPTFNGDGLVVDTDSVDTLDNIDLTGITTGQGVTWDGGDLVPADLLASTGGSDTHIQYNNGGVLGGEANFTYDDTTGIATIFADSYEGYSEQSLAIGDSSYGTVRVGNGYIGVCDRVTGNLDMDGSMYFRNAGGVSSNIEFLFLESPGNTVRFAIPTSGVGNATWNPRSMLLAGPDPSDDTAVTVGYWQGVGIFGNLSCDTSGSGADLGVQNDLEVGGDVFTDSIKESTAASGVTIDGLLVKDGGIPEGAVTEHEAAVNHDALTNFVANEHINHSSVTFTAGTGMTGGGTLAANRTFNVIGANSIDANANDIQLVNDEASPGADQVYGTNGSGVKGWKADPAVGAVWGSITGTIGDQTDLQAELDDKVSGPVAGTDNVLARFDGASGSVIQTGAVLLTDLGNLLVVNGSAGAPTYSFNTDTDNGIYRVGEDILGFSTSGSERFRIEANGTLSVQGTSNYEALVTHDDDIPNKKYVDDASAGGGLPDEYFKGSGTGTSTTTSTSPQPKVSVSCTGLSSGYTYAVLYSMDVGHASDDKEAIARVAVDGTTKCSATQSGKGATGVNYWNFGGVIYFTGESGTVYVDLTYSAGGDGGTAYSKSAYLQIWRVE